MTDRSLRIILYQQYSVHVEQYISVRYTQDLVLSFFWFLKKNQNAPRPSEHPPVRGKKCQNV